MDHISCIVKSAFKDISVPLTISIDRTRCAVVMNFPCYYALISNFKCYCYYNLQEAQTYAEDNGLLFMETSAKTASNVNEIFMAIGL